MDPESASDRVFVGRQRELGELDSALDDALAGRGRLCLIGGESGIGKSRLVDRFADRATDRGARVLWGRCWEAGGAPPFWPWVQAIRSLIRQPDPEMLLEQLGRGAADVAQMIPEIHELAPGLRAPASSDPEGARFRLFESTMTFLRNAGRAQPLVLILDDLHAADAPSFLLLRFVASELNDASVLVIGVYRDDGPENPALTSTLAELARLRVTRQLRLEGLDATEVIRLIESSVEAPAPAPLVDAVQRGTAGNPLFVGEVIRLMAAEGRLDATDEATPRRISIPPRIREVIDRRLALLSEACLRVLTVAAVLGWEFRLDALARATGTSTDPLLDIIDEAILARVLTEVPGTVGRMRFTHSLVCDAVYEGLPTTRRVRAHREIGEMLEALYAENLEPHLAELAHHFWRGSPSGDVDKAVEYARRAGERASSLLAFEESVRLFKLALAALESKELGGAEERCRLLLALGDAQARQGDLVGAQETFLQAADLARRRSMPDLLASAALGYGGRFVWGRAGSDRHLVPLLEEALRTLPESDSEVHARLLARLAGALREERSRERPDRLSSDAVEMARRIGDPATLSYALEGRFAATWWPDNTSERLAIADEMLELAREANDGERIVQGLDWRSIALMERGDVGAVDADLETAAILVDELRQPAQRWLLLAWRATRALLDGRFDEAERLIPEALDPGQRAQRWDAVFAYRLQMYFLRREQGRLEEIEATITGSVSEYPTRSVFRCLVVHLACELGRTADARGGFEALATDRFASLPKDNDWLFNLSLLAEVARYLGDVERARTLYELLSPYEGHAPTGGEVSMGAASRYLGVLASTLHRWDEAEAHLEQALERNTGMGARPWVAYTLHDHARVLLARDASGDQGRAGELLARAAAICERSGMRALGAKVSSAGRSPETALVASGGVRGPSGFHREGEYWSIRFDGDEFRLRDSKGLRYLAQLLRSPGREFLALDLVAAGSADGSARRSGATVEVGSDPSSGELGEIIDPRAHAGYRRRLEELQGEIDEAQGRGDPERASRARDEFDFIARELASAVGLGGRRRRGPSDAERARVNATKAIRAALSRIGEHSPSLGRHLSSTIRTGTFCSYVPDPRMPEIWHL